MESHSLRFTDLNLIDPLLKSLEAEGYVHPTPIQQQAIPHILQRRDLLGCAQTGTGKTAAFGLPILQLLAEKPAPAGGRRPIRCLVLTPTRELAAQIGESFDRYGSNVGINNTVIFGGVGQGPQVSDLRRGVDILVATPGRLLDLMEQRFVDLAQLEIFVLDEADRMLDMGFIHDVKRVIKVLPKQRHSLFFSATMPPDIQRLASDILSNPVKVEVTPVATTAEKIQQSLYFVEGPDKRRLLEHVMQDASIQRALVFTRTKHGADKVAKFLNQAGVPSEAIHGNKSQNNRTRALNNFKGGVTRVLVATDIAARGIDIDGVTHVINYELPNIPESYVHRIGRTARAGAEGIALSFCDHEERAYLRDIERLIRMKIHVVEGAYPGSEGAGSAAARPTGPGSSRPPHMRPEPREPGDRPAPRSQHGSRGGSSSRSASPRGAGGGGRGPGGSGGRPHGGRPGHRPEARSEGAPQGERGPAPQRSHAAHGGGRPQGGSSAGGSSQGRRSGGGGQRGGRQQGQGAGRPTHAQGDRPSGGSRAAATNPRRSDDRRAAPAAPTGPADRPWWKKLISKKD